MQLSKTNKNSFVMKKKRISNYDKYPAVTVAGDIWMGWEAIVSQLKEKISTVNTSKRFVLVVECYQGVHQEELSWALSKLNAQKIINATTCFKSVSDIEEMTRPYLTDDVLFGKRAPLAMEDFFEYEKIEEVKRELSVSTGLVIIYGSGATLIAPQMDLLVYVDMARWEIQQRFRRQEVNGLGVHNKMDKPSLHYKRGYFIDWNVCDALKKRLIEQADYWLDTHLVNVPKMITGDTLRCGLEKTVSMPFRVVPFFDPAPWGGQWMKEVCGLDPKEDNYGWCFDCVPEENSLYLNVAGERFELASNTLVFYKTKALLGAPVEARFGQDFPIRFDFLDTMKGGNLSLQVHPITQYIRDTFGIYYTQDESYYILDAGNDATVYLGLKEGINPTEMIEQLNDAQNSGKAFDTDRFVNQFAAKKHDHYLIPAGTIHCSGAEAMVLEISATPSIFTFKLWDWGRLGLDGLPRPINIKHGEQVIQWERDTEFTKKYLVNHIEPIAEGEGWKEERTGLHENEFIETRRHWFTKTVPHHTGGGVNVLNVVEGDELIVESPTNAFEPYVVHYAETFIVPAAIGEYTIRPYGVSEGKCCGTIKASVRFNA